MARLHELVETASRRLGDGCNPPRTGVYTAIAGRIAPSADHEPGDVAAVLSRHHTEPDAFQVRLRLD